MIGKKVTDYINEQMEQGVTQQELHNKLIIVGDAVVKIKSLGKSLI